MDQSEFGNFRDGLAGVYSFYDKELTQFATDVWWTALKDFDLNAVTDAFGKHLLNTESGKWIPKPADIIRMLQGSTKDSALVAWSKVDKAVRHVGCYSDVVFDDPIIHRVINDMGGWIQFGTKTEDEWPFVAKEFENRYRGFKERSEVPECPGVLIGIYNSENMRQGMKLQPAVMIGDKEKCEQVMNNGTNKPLLEFTVASDLIKKGLLK